MGSSKKNATKKKQGPRPKTEDIKILKASGSTQQPAKQQNAVIEKAKPGTKIKKRTPRKRSRKPKQPNQSTSGNNTPEAAMFPNVIPNHIEDSIRNMVRDEISIWELSRSDSSIAPKSKSTPQHCSVHANLNMEQSDRDAMCPVPTDKKHEKQVLLSAIRQWKYMKPLDSTKPGGIPEFIMGLQTIRDTIQRVCDPNIDSLLLGLIVDDLPRTINAAWSTFRTHIKKLRDQVANFDDFVRFMETFDHPYWPRGYKDERESHSERSTRSNYRLETPSWESDRRSEYDSRYDSDRYQESYFDYNGYY